MVYIPDCDCVVDGSPHAAHMEAAHRAHFLEDKKYVVKDICIGHWEQTETDSIACRTGVGDTLLFYPDPDPAN